MTQLEQTQSVALDSPAASGSTNALFGTVLRVAWLSICLGLTLEVVLLVLAAFTGTAGDSPKPFISDLAQKVSWSFIVCVGLAFGSTASKAREGIMGALGLLAAPAGFTAARAAHKAVNGALETLLIPNASNAELKGLLQTGLKIFQGHQQHAEHVAAALK